MFRVSISYPVLICKVRITCDSKKILRRGCFFLVVLLLGTLQISDVLPTFFGIRFLPLLPLTIVLGMFERETYGLYYGLLAGIMWDMNVASGDGFNAFYLAFIGFFCGLLMTYLMMNNLITASILCTAGILLYFLLNWLIFVAMKGLDGGTSILIHRSLPTAALNIVTFPLYYYGVRAIMKSFKLKENDELSF